MIAQNKNNKNFSFFNSYVKGEILISGGKLVSNGLTFLNAFLLISFLEVFEYGVYLLIIAFFSLVSHIFLSPLQGVVFNDIARFIGENKEALAKRLFLENTTIQLSAAIVLSVAAFIGADLVALWYDKDVASLIRIISPIFLISALYTTMRMLFKARLCFGLIAARPIVYKVVRFIFLISFILFASLNVKNALWAHVGASIVALFVFASFFVKEYAPWKKVKSARELILWRIVKTYGKWSLFGGIFKSSVMDMKPWIIKFFVNTEAVAIYSIANMLYGGLKKLIPASTLKMLVPRIVHDKERTEKILFISIKYLFLFSILFVVFGAVAVPLLIQVFFPQYSESITLFYILLFAMPFLAFRGPMMMLLTALRRQRFIFILSMVISVNALITPFILLPLIGVAGMAVERVVTAVIVSALLFWYLTRHDIPLTAWRGVFRFDKHDKALFVRLIRLIREWVYKKISKQH